MIVSYPDKRNVNQWLIDWGDGTTSSAQVLARSYSMAHYYQQPDVTQGYLITATFTDTDGSETTMAVATHTVAGKQQTSVVPEYIAIDPVEEVEVEKIDTPKTAARNDSSITPAIRTDLGEAALNQLKYWNTKPADLAVRSNIANRFCSALSNGFSFALPTETLAIAPNEKPGLWSESFVEDLEDDFDFINDQTIAHYTNESTDSIILDMEEEMGEVELDLRIWGE